MTQPQEAHHSPTLAPAEFFSQMLVLSRDVAQEQPGRHVIEGLRIYFEKLTQVLQARPTWPADRDVVLELSKETENLAAIFGQAVATAQGVN